MNKAEKSDIRSIATIMEFMRTFDILNRYLDINLAQIGSKPIRFGVMNAIVSHGGKMNLKDLGAWTFRAPHTITSMIDSLEKDGLVRRVPNGNDRRSIFAVVTNKGWENTDKIVPVVENVAQDILLCLNDSEIVMLKKRLKQLRKHLLKEIASFPDQIPKKLGRGTRIKRE